MKTPVLLCTLGALALPATAAEAPKPIDNKSLKDAVAVSALLDADVFASDGREVGELGDILMTNDGKATEYLVEFDDLEDEYNRGATSFRDDVANYDEAPLYQGESNENALQLEYVAVPPQLVQPGKERITVDFSQRPLSTLPQRDHGVSRPSSGIYASDVIGMDVALSNNESFGEVEDVLLDGKGTQVVAYVVDSWDGLDKHRVALPADEAEFRRADKTNLKRENFGTDAISFPWSSEQVNALPEFDLDPYEE